jgi:hypothetical protein
MSESQVPDAPLLSGWKSIARYLDVGIRTLQRWEQSSGLPIRRPAGGLKPLVVAYQSELDAWVQRSQGHGSEPTSGELEPDRALLETIQALRAENRQLRRQLEEVTLHPETESAAGQIL